MLLAGCRAVSQFTVVPFDERRAPPHDSTLAYSVFLLGDGGAPARDGNDPVLEMLSHWLSSAGEHAAVVFLGDNIYPSGLPPEGDPARAEAERRINAQIETVRPFPGRILFVPGNHDWGGAGLGGNPSALRRVERYVEQALDRGDTWVPDAAFPGPVELRVTDWLSIVALDTQWWLEPEKQALGRGSTLLPAEGEVLVELHDILQRSAERDVIVVAHHPLFTNGPHGGRFRGSRRFFPHSFTRRYLGTPQDLSNFRYRRLREGLLNVLARHPSMVYAAGHDHNLQYFRRGRHHYVVSGSATRVNYAQPGRGASFVASERGMAILDYYADGSTWISFWTPSVDPRGHLLYRAMLQDAESRPVRSRAAVRDTLVAAGVAEQIDATEGAAPSRTEADPTDLRPYAFFAQDSITAAPGPHYRAGPLRRWLQGRGYRDLWTQPVRFPVIDLERTAGGLTVLRRGGGGQTISLRLQGEDGDQYVLRSVDKDPTPSVPRFVRETVAHDVLQDQTSAAHPYAAIALPPMLHAAGIYHTYPTLVVIPDDPRLGFYRSDFAGMVALFERVSDDDQEGDERLGGADDVIGSRRLFEKIEEDHDHRVDEVAYARARLFDMWVNDWDRHADQFRWARLDAMPGKIYQPIPRDRDFALFRADGLAAYVARKVGSLPARRFTDVTRGYHDLLGLNYSASTLDRRLTSSLSRHDWISIAHDLAASLPDSVIDAGLRRWPAEVYRSHGPETRRILARRRSDLPDAADAYYRHLARTVDVVGSDKHERFEVRRVEGSTEVATFGTNERGDIRRELFRRTFLDHETEEVRLYGLGGDDLFLVSGTGRSSIRIRAVGGSGSDTFVDHTHGERVYFYDTTFDSDFHPGPSTSIIASRDPTVNRYEMLGWEMDRFGLAPYAGVNSVDGLLLGGSARLTTYRFRKEPFASDHRLRAAYAYRNGAYNIHYRGEATDFFNPWDLVIHASVLTPPEWSRYFGPGNATVNSEEVRRAFASRLTRVSVAPHVRHGAFPFGTVRVGPVVEYVQVGPATGASVPAEHPIGLQPSDFSDAYFGGIRASLTVDGRDSEAATRLGVHWINQVEAFTGIHSATERFVRMSSVAAYFYTFVGRPVVTLAFRVGAARNVGEFRFYQANILGKSTNLRGFYQARFAGHGSAFGNLEARVTLTDLNLYLARGDFGVYGFLDSGRVWTPGEHSRRWHQGAGGGIWYSPLRQLVFTTGLELSRENLFTDLSIGFFF